jgi:hypothetical protein
MAIEATVDDTLDQSKPNYPYLGVGRSGVVVLFNQKDTGMVVREGGDYALGHYLDDEWREENFKPFTGTVTLRNKA